MQTIPATPVDRAEIPGMLATLCSYEAWFGPYHPQTLHLLTQVGMAYLRAGETEAALPVLERAVRDLGSHLRPDHELRLQALGALRDLCLLRDEFESAGAAQAELLRCQILRLGSGHPETAASRAVLASILMRQNGCPSDRGGPAD